MRGRRAPSPRQAGAADECRSWLDSKELRSVPPRGDVGEPKRAERRSRGSGGEFRGDQSWTGARAANRTEAGGGRERAREEALVARSAHSTEKELRDWPADGTNQTEVMNAAEAKQAWTLVIRIEYIIIFHLSWSFRLSLSSSCRWCRRNDKRARNTDHRFPSLARADKQHSTQQHATSRWVWPPPRMKEEGEGEHTSKLPPFDLRSPHFALSHRSPDHCERANSNL